MPDGGRDAPCVRPAPPYGTRVGSTMEGFVLPRCDGTMVDLYGPSLCESRVLVVTIAAGWCGACVAQSAQLTREIAEPYRDRGVRVYEVVYEDAEYGPPDAAFCSEWTAMGGVEGVEVVYNPTGIVPPFGAGADASSLPITVVADSSGRILEIVSGTSDGLTELKAAIDRALGG
jgi:thiol-disulfide isomerase/thioredoxin